MRRQQGQGAGERMDEVAGGRGRRRARQPAADVAQPVADLPSRVPGDIARVLTGAQLLAWTVLFATYAAVEWTCDAGESDSHVNKAAMAGVYLLGLMTLAKHIFPKFPQLCSDRQLVPAEERPHAALSHWRGVSDVLADGAATVSVGLALYMYHIEDKSLMSLDIEDDKYFIAPQVLHFVMQALTQLVNACNSDCGWGTGQAVLGALSGVFGVAVLAAVLAGDTQISNWQSLRSGFGRQVAPMCSIDIFDDTDCNTEKDYLKDPASFRNGMLAVSTSGQALMLFMAAMLKFSCRPPVAEVAVNQQPLLGGGAAGGEPVADIEAQQQPQSFIERLSAQLSDGMRDFIARMQVTSYQERLLDAYASGKFTAEDGERARSEDNKCALTMVYPVIPMRFPDNDQVFELSAILQMYEMNPAGLSNPLTRVACTDLNLLRPATDLEAWLNAVEARPLGVRRGALSEVKVEEVDDPAAVASGSDVDEDASISADESDMEQGAGLSDDERAVQFASGVLRF